MLARLIESLLGVFLCLQTMQGEGSTKEKWYLPAFLFWEKNCLSSPYPEGTKFSSSLLSLVALSCYLRAGAQSK